MLFFRSFLVMLCCSFATSAQVVDITSDLILCLPMNGNANDYSGNSNNGLVSGATPTVNRFGASNSAYHFDGINDLISIPSSTSFGAIETNDELTITGWCKNYAWSPIWEVSTVLEKYNPSTDWGWAFTIENINTVGSGLHDAFFISQYPALQTATMNVTLGQWEFYALTYSKSAQLTKFYKNGVLTYTAPNNGLALENTGSGLVYIGFSPVGYDEYSLADYDEIRVYNRALTQAEINAVYNLQTECDAAPPVSSFSISSSQTCVNQSVQFYDQSVNTPTAWFWQFSGATPATSTLSMPTVTWTSPGTYTVSLTASNGNGPGTVAEATITVLTAPQITAINNSPLCPGSSLQLSTGNAANFISYQWTGPQSFQSNLQSPLLTNFSAVMTGAYSVTATYSNGCQSTASVVALALPEPTLTVIGSTVCPGEQATLTATGSASSYTWIGVAGFTTTAQNVTLSATPAVAGNYTVIAIDQNLCTSIAIATLLVKPTPSVTATGFSVCYGSQGTLTASGASVYQWLGPNTFSSTSQNPILPSTTNLQSQTYTVVGMAINGCTASAIATVIALPNPTLTAQSASVCQGASTTLSVSGASSYLWQGPGGMINNGSSVSFTSVGAIHAGIYTITGIAATSGCSSSVQVGLVVNQLPVVTTTGGTICVNTTATMSASAATGVNLLWTGPFGFSASGSGAITTPSATGTMVYTVLATAPNSCTNSAVALLQVLPAPQLSVTATPSLICAGQSALLVAGGAASYQWQPPLGLSAAQVTVTPLNTSTYTVYGYNEHSCMSQITSVVSVDACTGMNDPDSNPENQLTVFPNPSNGTITLAAEKEKLIEVVTPLGQIIQTIKIEGTGNLQVSIDGLTPGIYFARDTQGKSVIKIVVR